MNGETDAEGMPPSETERLDFSRPVKGGAPFPKRQLLAISGGGYRGLFAAEVLAHFESSAPSQIRDRFDMIAGTSIGAIIATGLVFGIPAQKVVDHFHRRGQKIFRKRWLSVNGILGPKYDWKTLRSTISEILGENASVRLSEVREKTGCDLLITTVDKTHARFRSFCSFNAATSAATNPTVLDACMASAAAPTFFKPQKIEGVRYVDGGIAANAPEAIAALEAKALFRCSDENLHIMSVGTMGRKPVASGNDVGGLGMLAWALTHNLFQLIISVQEYLAVQSAKRELGPQNYLRVDYSAERDVPIDDTSESARATLRENAGVAVSDLLADNSVLWNSFARHNRLSVRNAAS